MKTQHTPGPWQVAFYGEKELPSIKYGSLTIARLEYVDDGESNRITHANAIRISDCVNACVGLEDPASAIDAWVHQEPSADVARLKAQVAELRGALQRLLTVLNQIREHGDDYCFQWRNEPMETCACAICQAIAALARTEKGQTT